MLSEADRLAILGDVNAQLVEFTTLIGDLVALARDETGRRRPEPMDFRDVVNAALDRVRRAGQGLQFDVELNPLYVVGDSDTLERAVTNLLDNAVKWSPPGGTIRVQLEGDRLRVADQGPGIAEADLPHVFDRFYRADTARNTPGTGLGLSIVAQTVDPARRLGHGPAARPRAAPSSPSSSPARPPSRPSPNRSDPPSLIWTLSSRTPRSFGRCVGFARCTPVTSGVQRKERTQRPNPQGVGLATAVGADAEQGGVLGFEVEAEGLVELGGERLHDLDSDVDHLVAAGALQVGVRVTRAGSGHRRRRQVIDRGRATEMGVNNQTEVAEHGQRPIDRRAVHAGNDRLGPEDDLIGPEVLVGGVQHFDDRLPDPGHPLTALP